ncbi:testis-expressed protein 48 isoform X4 [Tamandua tetradactyla]|uniref:testis-expressed protein 48 isoform X4 n=1 Tax=Tamandua tetradactyla TaxID=48850 RepID=UPI0040538422
MIPWELGSAEIKQCIRYMQRKEQERERTWNAYAWVAVITAVTLQTGNSPAQRTVLNPKISEFNKAPLQPIQTWPQRSSVVAARTARGPPPLFAPTVRGGPNRFIGRSPSI